MTISTIINILKRKDTIIRRDKKVEVCYLGNVYGGFSINEEKLSERSIVYSFGIGEDASFSMDLIKRYNSDVWAYDPTPKSIKWVENNIHENKFHFGALGISDENVEKTFYLPNNDEYVSGSEIKRDEIGNKSVVVNMRTLKKIMNENGHDHIDILKMDIEGSEFSVIENILNDKILIDQICLETHQRFYDDGAKRMKKMVNELHVAGYQCIYISKNHETFTFIKQD